jgi:AmmeMemoRadiSam system protein A
MTDTVAAGVPAAPRFPADAGSWLTGLARDAIGRHFSVPTPDRGDLPGWLAEPGASFVTLTLGGELRGCIGSLTAYLDLADDVRGNAQAAAFRDPRFPPLSALEFDEVGIEVSVLSEPVPMSYSSQDDALAQLRPGVDGIVLRAGAYRATFLPQVWEDLPEPAEFLRQLKRKAGLPSDYWAADVKLSRYVVTAFKESRP